MTAYPMQEMYEMDGLSVPRFSPSYHQQPGLQQSQQFNQLNHVPTGGMQLQPLQQQQQHHHHYRIQSSPQSTFDPNQPLFTNPIHTYQPSQQMQQQQLQPPFQIVQPQPVIVIDPLSLSLPLLNDRTVKMDYIRKVLGVLFTQIGICFLIVNVFNLRTIKDWTQNNVWFVCVVLASAVVILMLLACFAESHQDCPVNSLLTAMFTLFASLTIGASSSYSFFEDSLNLIYFFDVTLIITFALIFSLILYAFQSNYDFNLLNCIKYIVLIVTVFIVIYLILIVVWSSWLALFLPTVFYAGTCSLIFTLYVVTDLTFMIQRCLYNSLTPESVMLAVIYLHTDIVNRNGNFWGRC